MEEKLKVLKKTLEDSGLMANFSFDTLNNCLIIKKFNWDYLDCLKYQEILVELVYKTEYQDCSIFIFTNHPSCLTLGRGLQRRQGDAIDLVDFNPDLISKIELPVFNIKRGGGITFHHPGQIVIYPIINLSFNKMKVYTMMNNLLSTISSVFRQQGITGLDYCRDLLGMWFGDKKIASIGVQVRRFVSFHGVAVNLKDDIEIQKVMNFIFPCGLPGNWYSSIKKEFDIDIVPENFSDDFCSDLKSLFSKDCLIR